MVGEKMKKIRNLLINIILNGLIISALIIIASGTITFLGSCHKHEHTIVIDPKVDPTCTSEGLTEGSHCQECGKIIVPQEKITKLDHQPETVAGYDATCKKEGMTDTIKCHVCGTILEEAQTIPIKDHTYGDWVVVQEPTYTSPGRKIRVCSFCYYRESESVEVLDANKHLEEIASLIVLPKETDHNLDLPTKIEDVTISWQSSNENLISSKGILGEVPSQNTTVTLKAILTVEGFTKECSYQVVYLAVSNSEKLEKTMAKITFPDVITTNLFFMKNLEYDIVATYNSDNQSYLTNEGIVYPQQEEVTVFLTILLALGDDTMEKTFELKIAPKIIINKPHQILEYAKELDLTSQTGLKKANDRIVLADDKIEATYVSKEISTIAFKSLVGSWAAISSTNATCELQISIKVDGVWSDFITYSPWGLGLKNASYDQTKNLIKLNDDEVMVLNGKTATAIKYMITLRRNSLNDNSPALSLVSFALDASSYSYQVDTSKLPTYVCYDVPKLYQGAVPVIGGSICSATSTTMLLKYRGFNFSDKDEFEHRYIAGIVKDYGNDIYGNWVYNTVTMGGYGLNAYVARMYSVDELMYHLATVGPVALSVKGQMTSTAKDYYTNGHLIVAIGYKYINNTLYIICNDPNVPTVYCEYSLSVINNTWRNIAYVVEK